jgi:hypothetical protein
MRHPVYVLYCNVIIPNHQFIIFFCVYLTALGTMGGCTRVQLSNRALEKGWQTTASRQSYKFFATSQKKFGWLLNIMICGDRFGLGTE